MYPLSDYYAFSFYFGNCYQQTKLQAMRISIIAHPNSKKPRVEKDLLGTLHVYVAEPALEWKANRAVIEALAEYFHTKKGNVTLLQGEKLKTKLFEIVGIQLADIVA